MWLGRYRFVWLFHRIVCPVFLVVLFFVSVLCVHLDYRLFFCSGGGRVGLWCLWKEEHWWLSVSSWFFCSDLFFFSSCILSWPPLSILLLYYSTNKRLTRLPHKILSFRSDYFCKKKRRWTAMLFLDRSSCWCRVAVSFILFWFVYLSNTLWVPSGRYGKCFHLSRVISSRYNLRRWLISLACFFIPFIKITFIVIYYNIMYI